MRKLIQYWLPVAVWTAVIIQATGRTFDTPHTTTWLSTLFRDLGIQASNAALYVANHAIRKLGHLTEYAILAALSFRAVRDGRSGFTLRWALIALAIVAGVASTDEFLQSFTPTRTATPWDVLLDACGGTIALFIIRHCASRNAPPPSGASPTT